MKRITLLLLALGAALLCTVSCEKNKKGYDGNPVSLGLSVRWAEMNVGAIEGDLDGVSVTLADAIDYAAQNKKWSIPTVMQWEELLNTDGVKVQPTLSPAGYLIIGKGGQSIFFPSGYYLCAGSKDAFETTYVDLSVLSLLSEPSFATTTSKNMEFSLRLVRK